MTIKLDQAHTSVKHARGLLKEALHDAGAMEALFIMQLLETSQRLLYDIEALQSAVRADSKGDV